jgi:hypothetical protein
MLVQLASLALSASQARLSDDYPRPATTVALQQMVSVQIAAAALLSPWLLRSWPALLVALAGTLPFVQLASFLSATAMRYALWVMACVALWLLVLCTINLLIRGGRWRMICSALALLWALGGPLLIYLRLEFTSSAPISSGPMASLQGGPIISAIWLSSRQPSLAVLAPLLVVGLLGAVVLGWRQFIHRSYTESHG